MPAKTKSPVARVVAPVFSAIEQRWPGHEQRAAVRTANGQSGTILGQLSANSRAVQEGYWALARRAEFYDAVHVIITGMQASDIRGHEAEVAQRAVEEANIAKVRRVDLIFRRDLEMAMAQATRTEDLHHMLDEIQTRVVGHSPTPYEAMVLKILPIVKRGETLGDQVRALRAALQELETGVGTAFVEQIRDAVDHATSTEVLAESMAAIQAGLPAGELTPFRILVLEAGGRPSRKQLREAHVQLVLEVMGGLLPKQTASEITDAVSTARSVGRMRARLARRMRRAASEGNRQVEVVVLAQMLAVIKPTRQERRFAARRQLYCMRRCR